MWAQHQQVSLSGLEMPFAPLRPDYTEFLANMPGQMMAPVPATSSTLSQPVPMTDTATFSTIFNSLHPGEDHTFGPGAVAPSLPNASYPAGNSISHFGQLTPSTLDPAQFIWAVSSQLPQVEESSPNDERSGSYSTGPSPNVDDKGKARRSRRNQVNAASEGSKLVKITWWRPHGAVSVFRQSLEL